MYMYNVVVLCLVGGWGTVIQFVNLKWSAYLCITCTCAMSIVSIIKHTHTHMYMYSYTLTDWFDHLSTFSDLLYDPHVLESGHAVERLAQCSSPGREHLSGIPGTS